MIEFITFVVGAGVGGAAVWFFKNKALAVLEEAKQELEEKFSELKDKVKKD
jgi:hypothetical protein